MTKQAWRLKHPVSMKLGSWLLRDYAGWVTGIWQVLPVVCERWVAFLELTTDFLSLNFQQ